MGRGEPGQPSGARPTSRRNRTGFRPIRSGSTVATLLALPSGVGLASTIVPSPHRAPRPRASVAMRHGRSGARSPRFAGDPPPESRYTGSRRPRVRCPQPEAVPRGARPLRPRSVATELRSCGDPLRVPSPRGARHHSTVLARAARRVGERTSTTNDRVPSKAVTRKAPEEDHRFAGGEAGVRRSDPTSTVRRPFLVER